VVKDTPIETFVASFVANFVELALGRANFSTKLATKRWTDAPTLIGHKKNWRNGKWQFDLEHK